MKKKIVKFTTKFEEDFARATVADLQHLRNKTQTLTLIVGFLYLLLVAVGCATTVAVLVIGS